MAGKTVGSAEQLLQALKGASSGDVILLEPGVYSGVILRGLNLDNVTIQSRDPQNPAILHDLLVRDSSGIAFKNLEFYVDPSKGIYQFQVIGSSDIHFSTLHVHGSLNSRPSDDKVGLIIRESKDVSVSDSLFEQLWHGISHLNSNDLLFTGNKFQEIRTDGIRGGGSSDVTITKNVFTDFYPAAGDHPDAIQFWTTHTTQSARNITITDNIITRGDGSTFQGIFIRDNVGNIPFENVTISNNIVLGGLWNGIAVAGSVGLKITGNTVVGFSDQKSWIRVQDSVDPTVSNNVAQQFLYINSAGVVSTGNREVPAATDSGAAILENWLRGQTDNGGEPGEALPSPSPAPLPPVSSPVPHPPTPVEPATPPSTTRIEGTGADDRLRAVPGENTTLSTGDGNDVLTGGGGRNTLIGGNGNDWYNVVDLNDQVRESQNGGFDTVSSSVDYTLGEHIEVLRLVGAARSGTGNELDNRIIGTNFADKLFGLTGNDTLQGLRGDDTLWGGAGADDLRGDDGNDQLFGGEGPDKLLGGRGNDVLDGGDGSDWLEGGAGADQLTGGAGSDLFVFRPGDFSSAVAEKITDFDKNEGDRISLSLLDANTRTAFNDKFEFIGTESFGRTPGQLRYELKGDDAHVYGDTNGDGRADFTIVISNVSSVSSWDFLL